VSDGYVVPADIEWPFSYESWIAWDLVFDPTNLPVTLQAMDESGFHVNFLLRAVTDALPAPDDCNGNGIPDDCELCGDLDDDGDVDYYDYVIFLDAFGGPTDGDPAVDWCCDFDDSGAVGMTDYAAWLACYREFVGKADAGPPTNPDLRKRPVTGGPKKVQQVVRPAAPNMRR
jgi:hypothetical protein